MGRDGDVDRSVDRSGRSAALPYSEEEQEQPAIEYPAPPAPEHDDLSHLPILEDAGTCDRPRSCQFDKTKCRVTPAAPPVGDTSGTKRDTSREEPSAKRTNAKTTSSSSGSFGPQASSSTSSSSGSA
eukprot:8576646-Pyramimonas_sp.AAC.1